MKRFPAAFLVETDMFLLSIRLQDKSSIGGVQWLVSDIPRGPTISFFVLPGRPLLSQKKRRKPSWLTDAPCFMNSTF